MTEILVISCLALTTALVVVILRLHRERTVSEMIRALARVNDGTRRAIQELDHSRTMPLRPATVVKGLADLAVFWWNSRIFLQISNQLVSAIQSPDVSQVVSEIVDNHKELVKLVVVSCGEKLVENVLRIRLGQYQAESMVRYARAEDLLGYLVAYWRPEYEGLLGEKI